MKRVFMASSLMMISTLFRNFRGIKDNSLEMTKLQLSSVYLKGVRTLRLLFISLLVIGLCLLLLVTGLALAHIAILLYAPWEPQTKMIVTLLFGALYFGGACFIFYNLFAEENWIKMLNADEIVERLSKYSKEASVDESEINRMKSKDDNGKKIYN